jgi:hypothetical protein
MFGESAGVIASAIMKSPNIPKMPSKVLRELAIDFVIGLQHLTTDPAYPLETWEEMFILWLHEEPNSPPSNVLRHVLYDGSFRKPLVDRLPEGPPPKGSRGYVQKGKRGHSSQRRPK